MSKGKSNSGIFLLALAVLGYIAWRRGWFPNAEISKLVPGTVSSDPAGTTAGEASAVGAGALTAAQRLQLARFGFIPNSSSVFTGGTGLVSDLNIVESQAYLRGLALRRPEWLNFLLGNQRSPHESIIFTLQHRAGFGQSPGQQGPPNSGFGSLPGPRNI